MKHLKIWRSLLLALATIGVAGCSAESLTAPKLQSEANPGLVTDLLGVVFKKNVLKRKTALTSDITVSASIGSEGGTLSIPKAGFTLTIPRGAVSNKTNFTVTAIKGSLVAYEFAPHGIKFAKSLSAKQDLRVTQWSLLSLKPLVAGYFTDRSKLDLLNATALLSQLIGGVLSPLTQQFTFGIDHFSGYVVAW